MSSIDSPEFPCGLIVTDSEKRILFVNSYFQKHLSYINPLIGHGLESLFTKASLILFESYLYPQLLVDGKVEELQASIFDGTKKRLPVVINAELYTDNSISWSIFISVNRDNLYEELLSTREQLEANVERLKLMAETDDLTGLLNRKEALSRTEQILQHCFRQNKHLSIILMDIDFFKQVNDIHGHSMGDKVLVEIAKVLKNEARITDVVARWGGEEFLVTLYDSDAEASLAFTKRIQDNIIALNFFEEPVTISSGIAVYLPDEIANNSPNLKPIIDKVINKADSALYEAKQTGRKKAVVYTEKNDAKNK